MLKNKFVLLIITVLVISGLFYMFFLAANKGEYSKEVKAKVIKVDDTGIEGAGLFNIGKQDVYVKISEGEFSGKKIKAINQLTGSLGWDYRYSPGEKILIGLVLDDKGGLKSAVALEIYRQNWTFVLCLLFVLCLILYSGYTGLRALISFIGSIYIIWYLLIPGLLNGLNPIMFSGMVLVILSAMIIFSIAGFTKKGLSAFFGTICSLFITIGIVTFFGEKLALDGMSAPYVGQVIFAGNMDLNMRDIFFAAVVIGASGAAMDISMDMAATIREIKEKKPEISIMELIKSGFNVGSAVIGTMTTTLLLAYSGSYLTLLMALMTREASYNRIINSRMIVSEILRTLTGSMGIVLAAPLTTVFAAWIYNIDISWGNVKEAIFNKN